MNSSAKLFAVTFVAATALGATVLMGGCTVTTSNDTDGGTTNSSSGSSGSGTDSSTTSDTGTNTDSGPVCDTTKQTQKFAVGCQTCLESKCCTQLTTCFGLAKEPNKLDCNGLTECVTTCRADTTKTPAEQETCANECADVDANSAGVIDAYNNIIECTNQQCATDCD